jgi:uncharacterized protein (TIGR03435 family)
MAPAKQAADCARALPTGTFRVVSDGPSCRAFPRLGRTGFDGVAVNSGDIANALRAILKRPVVDRANLPALFDVSVHWRPDGLVSTRGGSSDGPRPESENQPDIHTALREQLGLRLDVERAPIPMLIVDSAERPTAN